MTELDEIKAEVTELRSSVEGLRKENAELREELAGVKELAAGAMLGKRLLLDGNEAHVEQGESERTAGRRLFWAFLKGVGSVMEIYPPEGCFDRWLQHEEASENEYALLFRDIWESTHAEQPSDGAEV